MVSYIFLALFIAVSLLHLYDSWRDNHRRRRYTKPLLLILLTLFYCFAAEKIDWVLVAALLFSWLGDVLLMPSGTKWFVSGGISFLVSHILFIFVYSPHVVWQSVTWWIVIPLAPAAAKRSIRTSKGPWNLTSKVIRTVLRIKAAFNSDARLRSSSTSSMTVVCSSVRNGKSSLPARPKC